MRGGRTAAFGQAAGQTTEDEGLCFKKKNQSLDQSAGCHPSHPHMINTMIIFLRSQKTLSVKRNNTSLQTLNSDKTPLHKLLINLRVSWNPVGTSVGNAIRIARCFSWLSWTCSCSSDMMSSYEKETSFCTFSVNPFRVSKSLPYLQVSGDLLTIIVLLKMKKCNTNPRGSSK